MKKWFALLLSCFACVQALAWNSVGHRAVAELAWRQMNAAERQAATELLRQHPHYEAILIADVPAGVDTNEWTFLTAAVWPDLVRPAKPGQPERPEFITKYNVHPHGIELPFIRRGETNRALLKAFPKSKSDLGNVMTEAIKTLQDPKQSAHDRAVSLGWVLHLLGDSHQPLHTATLVSSNKPKGYELGGQFIVLDQAGAETSLHTFWDQLPGTDASYAGVVKFADELQAAPELQRSRLRRYREHKTVAAWVNESFEDAVKFAYAEDQVGWADIEDLKSGKVEKSAIPALTPDYIRQSREITKQRLSLASFRLTDILKETW